ncbi:4-oxalomesaconate tautomerase (EC [Amycolatopsis camponoti]|uniref:4-oxalomesaconate tautomerase (EC) n=1 Tax=Amycolatopsis camponoti TaxID=2606593 RepID=A0A6I8LLN5_9PSEU|nr:4-oxalomesaconate tautomerase [Amycolatopsis camponoti]VVJ17931.1 4-oxalomesaconate tautomerase (EC [Amycolatopsis camponoti]
MTGVRCMLLRGGTSKGAYFLAEDLPADPPTRDDLLMRIMGTPDPRQIDGVGGAQPVTSKVAIVSAASDPGHDIDYLFLQLGVEEPTVSDRQTCGNLLAGVGQFAVERGLVPAGEARTTVRVRLVNTGTVAVSTFATPGGEVDYRGDTAISGVPGTAAPVELDFTETEGSVCGSLLPTGAVRDNVGGIEVSCVDNGMPVVVARAGDLGITGYESAEELSADTGLAERIDALRVEAGKLMGLGDVRGSSVPKTTLVAAPRDGGAICTRTFIPVKPHPSIGVLGGVSVVTALLLDGAVGSELLEIDRGPVRIEHPSGQLAVAIEFEGSRVRRSTVIRTARKLFDGTVFPRP